MNFEEFKSHYQNVPVGEYPNRVLEAVPEPVVSVQVSTYQHADFIRDCLDGILMQETDFPFEILIGEDESSDGTREICKAYADRHPDKIRLFLHRRENNIAIHGRPTGKFQSTYTRFMCRGTYIALCEGDDYWTDPLKLQKQVDFLEANPGYVMSRHDSLVIDSAGKVVRTSNLSDRHRSDYDAFQLRADQDARVVTASVCFRNLINYIPHESLRVLNGDTFLYSMLGQYGKSVFQGNVDPARYRVHENSSWSSEQRLFRLRASANTYERLALFYRRQSKPREQLSLLHNQLESLRTALKEALRGKCIPSAIHVLCSLTKTIVIILFITSSHKYKRITDYN